MRSRGLVALPILLALPEGGRGWVLTSAHVSRLRLRLQSTQATTPLLSRGTVLCSTYRDSRSEQTRLENEEKHGSPIDGDSREALNEVASRVVRVCVAGDDGTAAMLAVELEETAAFVAEEGERDAARFLQQAAKLLRHEMPNPEGLSPTYLKAFDRLLSAVVGTVWRLGAEDESESDSQRYAEEQAARPGGGTGGGRSAGAAPAASAKRSFYEILGVAANVERSEIRRAFRAAALETHPDVNEAPDAADAFMRLSRAYEVLYDPQLRETYDRYGEEAVDAAGAGSSAPTDGRYSAADDEWAHLRRQAEKARSRKKGKRARAREQGAANAAAAAGGTDVEDAAAGDSALGAAEWTGWAGVPLEWRKGMVCIDKEPGKRMQEAEFGDVVLYPLPESVRMEEDDGRERGVGIVVGRNIDRGDAARIPHDLLGLCEVAPLEQSADGRWREDEIAVSTYPHIETLKVIPISGFAKAAAGEGSGAWSLVGDYAQYSPQHYFEEIIL